MDIAMSILDIVFLALLLFIVHFYTETTWTNRLSFLPAWLTDHHSLWPIGIVFLLFCAKNFVSFLIYTAQSRFRYGVASRISKNNLLRYLEGDYSDYINTDSSIHMLQIVQQPIEFCQYILAGIQQGITEWTLIGVTVIAVLLFNAKLFLLLLILLLPPVIIASYLTKKKLHNARVYIKSSRAAMMQHLQESITGFVESNLYDKNSFFANRYTHAQYELNRHLGSLQAVQGAPSRLAEIFAVFGLLALISIGHFSGNIDSTGFVTLGAFLAAAYKIIPGIARVLNIAGQIRTYEFSIKDLVKKGTRADRQENEGDAKNIFAVRCRHIGFHYGKNEILNDFNLSIQRGDFLGVHGNSGKGKSTILHILLGFLKPGQGEVLFNGEACDEEGIRRYWKNIAYVKQQPFIINDTILANITMEEEKKEAERLQSVLLLSGLVEVIKKLPGGIGHKISESGKNISGGQRQRIALARALYKNADLIILDEPFSELDEVSEERLLLHFKQLALEGKMVILITHNKKSLAYCNATLSLDEGSAIDKRVTIPSADEH